MGQTLIMTSSAVGAAATPSLSFDATFEREYERLVRSLAVSYGNHEAAADAVQDAFVAAHRRWRKLQTLDDPAGWIRRVALNRLISRHRHSLKTLPDRGDSPDPSSPADNPDVEDLRDAISDLPTRQRLSIVLHYLGGYSTREIAHLLDVAESTVRSNLHDGRLRLRRAIEDKRDGR